MAQTENRPFDVAALNDLRARLDGIDRQLVALMEERLQVAEQVARVKLAEGLPILDAAREQQVLRSRAALAQAENREAMTALFTQVMALSRARQARVMEENRHA